MRITKIILTLLISLSSSLSQEITDEKIDAMAESLSTNPAKMSTAVCSASYNHLKNAGIIEKIFEILEKE